VAGGPALERKFAPAASSPVALLGGEFAWAAASWTFQTRTLATKAASVVTFVSILLPPLEEQTFELV